MPDIITHYIFGLDTAHHLKESPLYPIIKEHKELFYIGLMGPDPFYFNRLGKKDSAHTIGVRMHNEKTGDFLMSALCYVKKLPPTSDEFGECLSYLSGFMCHYILDSMAHPYIFFLSGRYIPGLAETDKYKGLHKKIELAIDSILCDERFNVKSSSFKINDNILKDIKIPNSIEQLLDNSIFLLYGIHNAGATFTSSYHHARTYYKTTYDRMGAKKAFVNIVTPLTPKSISPFLDAFSYYNCVNPDYDYMNKKRNVWLHPVTGNVYTFTFYDILRNANKKSVSLLLATYSFITGSMSSDDYRVYLPNISYLTGLDTSDTRPIKYISTDYINIY